MKALPLQRISKNKNDYCLNRMNMTDTKKQLLPTEGDIMPTNHIENLILDIRGQQVMLDRDLANLYGVDTKVLNQAVKRNIERFPVRFRFQLSDLERDKLVTNCDRLQMLKHSNVNPFVFTEQGVAMLSTVLRSKTAINVSIQIMDAFTAMRQFIASNAQIFQRLDVMEQNQLAIVAHQTETDHKLEEVFRRLDSGNVQPHQGIFYDGQIFDAYTFINDRIREATTRIILIDNYIDDSVLTILSKRADKVAATIYTKKPTAQLQLDIQKHNAQYPPISVVEFDRSHDRFLCIDETVFHLGASIKDLGKKWFAFCRMDMPTSELLQKLPV